MLDKKPALNKIETVIFRNIWGNVVDLGVLHRHQSELECQNLRKGRPSEDNSEMEFSLRLMINPVQIGKLPTGSCSLVTLLCTCPWERMGKVHGVVRYLLGSDWEPGMVDAALPEVPVWGILLYSVKG